MQIDLSGKTALVTGSTKGIGLAVAKGLARSGAAVVLNGRSQATLDAAVAEIRAAGGEASGVAADVGEAAGCAALIDAAPACDILVSNAAFIGAADVFDADEAVWRQAWETNVMAAVRLSQHYLPAMGERGWGRLVLVSSESARNLQTNLVPYGATKLALHALSRGVAKRMAGTGVTANVVVPGPTLSDLLSGLLAPAAEKAGETLEETAARFVAAHRGSSLIRRMATVEEVAAAILFVCSPEASAITGSALRVDGGVVEDVN